MPGISRLDTPGLLNHVMIRGIERRKIFTDDKDRDNFIERYESHVEKGIAIGRRPELTGGGLIRSLGGWDEIKKKRRSGQNRIKGDQRILGGHDFVTELLAESEDQFSRKYRLRAMGYDFGKIVERTCNLFQVEKDSFP